MGIIVPKFSIGKSGSTKDIIINLLVEEWPLTAKQIFESASKNSASGLSYQAVHKTLSDLVADGVVTRQGTGYALSRNWIEQVQKFSQNLGAIYSEEKRMPTNYSFDKPIFLTFNSFPDIGRFLIYDFHGAMQNPPEKIALCIWHHSWPIIGFTEKDYSFLAKLFACKKYYSITKSNDQLDKLLGGVLEKLGKQTVYGVKFSAQQDTFVHDDIIMQVFQPPELSKEMDRIYSATKVSDIDVINNLFKDFLAKETKINAIIFKNKELADKLREEVLEIFAKARK